MAFSIRQLGPRFLAVTILILSLALVPEAVNATLTVIQPSNADNEFESYQPNINYGAITWVEVRSGSTTYMKRTVVMFDLSSIPSGSRINSAYLSLYYFANTQSDPAGRTYTAYRVTEQWTEMGSSWNNRDTGTPWTTAGGVWTTQDSSSQTVPIAINQWMRWDVTGIVQQWITHGQTNYGFITRDPNDATGGYADASARFYSREGASTSPSLRPMLELDWELAAVGGVLMPVNTLAVLTPYLALVVLVGAVSSVYAVTRRHKA